MACTKPATGAKTSLFYILEDDCGVTPNPAVWTPFRFTGGVPQLSKDSLQSSELDASREITDLRTGSNQTSGDISLELSYGSFDDLLEAALGGHWGELIDTSGAVITVDDTPRTFSRDTGSYIDDGILIGDTVTFPGLSTGNNGLPFIVGSVTALVLTAAIGEGPFSDEGPTASNIQLGVTDELTVGEHRDRKSVV